MKSSLKLRTSRLEPSQGQARARLENYTEPSRARATNFYGSARYEPSHDNLWLEPSELSQAIKISARAKPGSS